MSKTWKILIAALVVIMVLLAVDSCRGRRAFAKAQIDAAVAKQKYAEGEKAYKERIAALESERDVLKEVDSQHMAEIKKLDVDREILKAKISAINDQVASSGLDAKNFLSEYNKLRDNYNALVEKDEKEIGELKAQVATKSSLLENCERITRETSARLDECNLVLEKQKKAATPHGMTIVEKTAVAGIAVVAVVTIVKIVTKK